MSTAIVGFLLAHAVSGDTMRHRKSNGTCDGVLQVPSERCRKKVRCGARRYVCSAGLKHSGKTGGDKHTDGGGMYLLVKPGGKYWRMDYAHSGKCKTLALGNLRGALATIPRDKTGGPQSKGPDCSAQSNQVGIQPGMQIDLVKTLQIGALFVIGWAFYRERNARSLTKAARATAMGKFRAVSVTSDDPRFRFYGATARVLKVEETGVIRNPSSGAYTLALCGRRIIVGRSSMFESIQTKCLSNKFLPM